MPVEPADTALEIVVAELALAMRHLVRRLRAEANPNALTLSQLAAMARLAEYGALTTADLARAECIKPQSMGAILGSLERDGLVLRTPHPTDGRQILFALTTLGKEEHRRRGIAKRAWLLAALAKLPAGELAALTAAIPLIKRLGDL